MHNAVFPTKHRYPTWRSKSQSERCRNDANTSVHNTWPHSLRHKGIVSGRKLVTELCYILGSNKQAIPSLKYSLFYE